MPFFINHSYSGQCLNILINDVELMQDATDMNKIHFERKSLIVRLQAGILQQVFKREELSST